MVQKRGRSVPAEATQSPTLSEATTLVNVSSIITPNQPQPPQANFTFHKADALARMTFELNLRAVGAHADRLEREVRTLVQYTENDKEFRRENESRMQDIMREIGSVKAHMASAHGETSDLRADLVRHQQESKQVMDEVRKGVGELRSIVDSLTNQLERIPSPNSEEAVVETHVSPVPSSPQMQTRAKTAARKWLLEQSRRKKSKVPKIPLKF